MERRSDGGRKKRSQGMGRVENVAHRPNTEAVFAESGRKREQPGDFDRNEVLHEEFSKPPGAAEKLREDLMPPAEVVAWDMSWEYAIELFVSRHSTARGLRASSMKAYRDTLRRFRKYVRFALNDVGPAQLRAVDIVQYLEYLRCVRKNGIAALNTTLYTLKGFFGALVAMGHLHERQNPVAHFPKMKAPPRKMPQVLSVEEMERLLAPPGVKTVLSIRNWAIATLLYSTGIRASECATLTEENVDMQEQEITVEGKGGRERTLPFEKAVADVLQLYRQVRGVVKRGDAFFRSRNGGGMSRNAIYYSVRSRAKKAGITRRVSPHRLRHTFATHLVKKGENIRAIQKMLGHVWVSSTQVYVHVTAQDLREAAKRHPVEKLIGRVESLLPNVKIPFQEPRKSAFA